MIDTAIYVLVFICLIWAAYKDIKSNIIPDLAVILIGLVSIGSWYFQYGKIDMDYLFYFLFPSGIILLLGLGLDFFSKPKKDMKDLYIFLFSLAVALLVPLNFELRYIIFFVLLIVIGIMKDVMTKSNEDESTNVGGGDIKLIAVLGPILQNYSMWFLAVTMFCAFIFMKIKKSNNIYLAPFMLIGFIVFAIMKLYFGGIA